ncbi:MAG: hypothetical protein NZV14_02845 [Bryobacteraceae bacterium]|nr:hypothetical protein [Bryobacteraceae bacterium]MDW8377071.1 hypothetical protein [Bryobacterales bacterium]
MKLADIRRLAIRKQLRVSFRLPQGAECIITETGLLKIPELKSVPAFNVEAELGAVNQFRLEPAGAEASRNRVETVSAAGLEKLLAATAATIPQTSDHEE